MNIQILKGSEAREIVNPFYEFVGSPHHQARDEDVFFILRDSQNTIGLVRFCIEEGISLLRSMNIHPEYRGKKLGLQLLKAFEEYINIQNQTKVFCIPYAHLEKFYSQIGFQKTSIDIAPQYLINRLRLYQSKYPEKEFIIMCRFQKQM